MSERPAWARACTCGETADGYFCYRCMAFAGTRVGEQASWSRPRVAERKLPEPRPRDKAFRSGRIEH